MSNYEENNPRNAANDGKGGGNGKSVSGQQSKEDGRGDSNKSSSVDMERYLKGVNYPADKDALLKRAKENSAPQDVMHVIESLKGTRYNSTVDVTKALGEVNRGGARAE